MEQELCRREVTRTKRSYKWPIICSLCVIVIGFMVNVIIALSYGDFLHMFKYPEYWGGFGTMILGAVMALVFFLLSLIGGASYSLVLTNKRVYSTFSKKLLFSKTRTFTKSYNLNKITSYDCDILTFTKKGITFYSLVFKTPTDRDAFMIDEEFYNKFVNAVNAAILTSDK